MNQNKTQIIVYRCKWCRKEFEDRGEAERHGVICGMDFDIIKNNGESVIR